MPLVAVGGTPMMTVDESVVRTRTVQYKLGSILFAVLETQCQSLLREGERDLQPGKGQSHELK